MPVQTDLTIALVTGLIGGFGHCAGMCGPIVATLSMRAAPGRKPFVEHLTYHAGRLATYTLLGAGFGLVGSFVSMSERTEGMRLGVMMLAGVIMVIWGVSSLAGSGGLMHFIESQSGPVFSAARNLMRSRKALVFLPLGLLMGLLPCGLSYGILIASAGSSDYVRGALLMLCFGLGTVPAMAVVGFGAEYARSKFRRMLARYGGLALVALGAYYIYKGIALHAAM